MSQITIDARDARLAILGYQPEVSRIYWSAIPDQLPVYGQTLDLSGCEITAVYVDGSEAVVTDYCSFSPDTGEAVPNANTLTVTATYTARSGKVCEADEVLPICTLDHIKIIIPNTVTENIQERRIAWWNGAEPSFSTYANLFGFNSMYVVAYWSQGGEIVRVTKLNTDEVLNSPNIYFHIPTYYPEYRLIQLSKYGDGDPVTNVTFDRFYTPKDSESVTYPNAYTVEAAFSFAGQTYTDTAYLSADVLLRRFQIVEAPLEYSGTETFTVDGRNPDDWLFEFSVSGLRPFSTFYPVEYLNIEYYYESWCSIFVGPDPGPYVQRGYHEGLSTWWTYEVIMTLTDGSSGKFKHQGPPESWAKFTCDDGVVTWYYYEKPEDEPQ